ncbi:MAG: alpha/beta fold hydrolase [Methanomassiliicoccus sp.]|nr:alpha/beta fold hydrolase [Methanomassiliicoccus sp.]
MPKIKVGDANIHYHVHGDGEPLMLITGFSGDLYNWKKAIPLLDDHYMVITFDNRGSGHTEAPDAPFTMAQMADDAAGLLDALNIDQVHVLGWSMGGNIAQELTFRHPGKVATLILMSTYIREPDRARFAIDAMIHSVREGASMDTFQTMMQAWCSTESFFRGKVSVCELGEGCDINVLNGFSRQKKALDAFDSRDRLQLISVPVLVVHGEEDIMVPLPYGERLAAGIPNSEFEVIEGAGHFLPPAGYVPLVLDFLAKHPLKEMVGQESAAGIGERN